VIGKRAATELLKAILLLLALLLAYWVFIRDKLVARRDHASKPDAPHVEKMVACAHCGIHVPKGDAIAGDGRHYCCDEHRKFGTS
jgi:uncharacterized protein